MIQRIYAEKDVSSMTIADVQDFIEKEDIEYSGDYGFEVKDRAKLVYSEN